MPPGLFIFYPFYKMEAQKTQTKLIHQESHLYLGKPETFTTANGQTITMVAIGKDRRAYLREDGRLQEDTFLRYALKVKEQVFTRRETLLLTSNRMEA